MFILLSSHKCIHKYNEEEDIALGKQTSTKFKYLEKFMFFS